MNALAWLKEYAARSQTADALENVKKQARADTANTFSTLIKQDQDREELAATFQGRNDLESIQQSGLTDRARIESRDKALAAAAALVKDRAATTEHDINNLQGFKDPAAARAFAAAREMDPGISEPIAANAEFVNKNAAEPIDHTKTQLLTDIRGAKTPDALKAIKALIDKGPYAKDPNVITAFAGQLQDAANFISQQGKTDAARQALINKRDNAPAKPFDVGRLITIENKIKALQASLTSGDLYDYTPGGTLKPGMLWGVNGTPADKTKEDLIKGIKAQIAFYQAQKDAMMVPAGSGFGGKSPVAAAPSAALSSEDALTAELVALLKNP